MITSRAARARRGDRLRRRLTTVVDTRAFCGTVWQAISCHQSQMTAYEQLKNLAAEHQQAIWGAQSFYRVFSTVNGGRARETDLFEGITR